MRTSAQIGDLVWVPDGTIGLEGSYTVDVRGPLLALVKALRPQKLRILVNVDGTQESLLVRQEDVYDIGDLYG
jgi:hypothetical protein